MVHFLKDYCSCSKSSCVPVRATAPWKTSTGFCDGSIKTKNTDLSKRIIGIKKGRKLRSKHYLKPMSRYP